MKTRLITLLTVLFSTNIVLGQSNSSSSNVTLNLKLYPINTLIVNPSEDHKVVNLEYKTKEDYLNGVSSLKENHLTIYSTGGYQISVQSLSNELTSNQVGNVGGISSNSVLVIPSNGSVPQDQVTYNSSPLGINESVIVKSNIGGVNKNYNIEYKGKDGNEYLNKYVSNQNPTVYSTSVIYTIVSK